MEVENEHYLGTDVAVFWVKLLHTIRRRLYITENTLLALNINLTKRCQLKLVHNCTRVESIKYIIRFILQNFQTFYQTKFAFSISLYTSLMSRVEKQFNFFLHVREIDHEWNYLPVLSAFACTCTDLCIRVEVRLVQVYAERRLAM